MPNFTIGMRLNGGRNNTMKLIGYLDRKSWLHEVNPLVKSVGMIMLITAAVISHKFLTPIMLIVFAFAILTSASIPISPILHFYKLVVFFSIGLILANFMFTRPVSDEITLIFKFGPIMATAEGLARGVRIVLRMLAILSVTSIFVLTTDPMDFLKVFAQLLHLQPRVAYPMLIGLRILPIFESELERVRLAQKVRRVRYKTFFHKLVLLSVPLLASAIRRAERISLAMAAKGLDTAKLRSKKRTKYSPEDRIFLFLSISFTFFLLVYTFCSPCP
ncbi:MAG: hypothetical protein DRQ10_07915 [Candidatus Hydrothermota bacterium]|nr:MAG: hypothetical protein DRQ10_07915 [Candidatus Hydrothermae bacterium]